MLPLDPQGRPNAGPLLQRDGIFMAVRCTMTVCARLRHCQKRKGLACIRTGSRRSSSFRLHLARVRGRAARPPLATEQGGEG